MIFVNNQIDCYNEEILNKERKRLKEVDHFTILDYIKTSIEILMNMKMEESEGIKDEKEAGKKK